MNCTHIFKAGKRTNREDLYNFDKQAGQLEFKATPRGVEEQKRKKNETSDPRSDKIKANGKVGKKVKSKKHE